MKSVGVAVTAIALAISAPAFAAGQTIPLATMTCKQFVDSPKDTIGVILTWMMGICRTRMNLRNSISPRWKTSERSSARIADRIPRTA
jgi:hypothetical protein